MAQRYYANAPSTTLASGINNSVVSLTVASDTGLPVQFPYTIIVDRGSSTEEVMDVTGAAGTTLDVTRGADSTTAFSHSSGAVIEVGISARDPREANLHVNSDSGVHGLTGTVVGTSDTQTLTNKTLSLATNTISGMTASKFAQTDASGNLEDTPTKAVPTGDVVGTSDSQTLTNKDLSSGNTFPSTLVTESSADTLTNKTISADSNTLSGLAASSFAMTNASGNLDGSASAKAIPTGAVVGTTDTQTLSGKTLTSPTINGGTLTEVTVTNDAVGDMPLKVNAVTSTTAKLQEWQINGVAVARVWPDGAFSSPSTTGLATSQFRSAAKAVRLATQSFADNIQTQVNLTQALIDPNGNVDTTNDVIVLGTGTWRVNGYVNWTGASGGERVMMLIQDDGVSDIVLGSVIIGNLGTADVPLSFSTLVDASAGDELRMEVKQNSGGALEIRAPDQGGAYSAFLEAEFLGKSS